MKYMPRSIFSVLKEIDNKKILLPAIQRKFVWNKEQIEMLFDSMLKGYPIGTFLFWYLDKSIATNYVFYQFHIKYDERKPNNEIENRGHFHDDIVGVLDGQQRLSSIFLGLKGTYTFKKPYVSPTKDYAYKESELYINLYTLPYIDKYIVDSDMNIILIDFNKNFEFKFLREDEVNYNQKEFWFKLNDIIKLGTAKQSSAFYEKMRNIAIEKNDVETFDSKSKHIDKCLSQLDDMIFSEDIITYYKEEKQSLDEVLDIFIRVNSGGKTLSKTDLLFSTIVANWSEGREEIEEFIVQINDTGNQFTFDNDFIMRCCLVLLDLPVLFKVESFKTSNVIEIHNKWNLIKIAITKTVKLLDEYGFNGKLLTSQNAVIIIAYYFYHGGDESDLSKANIRKYLLHSLLKNIFGGQGDQVIGALRNVFRSKIEDGSFTHNINSFDFEKLNSIRFSGQKSLEITKEDVEEFLNYKKGSTTFFVLSLLFPHIRHHHFSFHQDHIHPNSKFNTSNYEDKNIPEQNWEPWTKIKDTLPNLMLLEGRTNESKGDTDFVVWFNDKYKTSDEKSLFKSQNYIPVDEDLNFSNFENFYEKRKTILREKLITILKI